MRIDRLIVLGLLVSCKVVPITQRTYSEDLSIHRPVTAVEEEPIDTLGMVVHNEPYKPLKGHIKAEMDSISKIAYFRNKEGRFVDGFVIQIYSGTNREKAKEVSYRTNQLFPDLKSKMSYHQPNFRVKGGRFTDRLNAHRVYRRVKKQFPGALLIPERLLLSYE
ncbi:MAG: SPOR domain-containing protein [Ekhidna sp.]|nr:SPOR domain-containing protein [Ekhidna sp.]